MIYSNAAQVARSIQANASNAAYAYDCIPYEVAANVRALRALYILILTISDLEWEAEELEADIMLDNATYPFGLEK